MGPQQSPLGGGSGCHGLPSAYVEAGAQGEKEPPEEGLPEDKEHDGFHDTYARSLSYLGNCSFHLGTRVRVAMKRWQGFCRRVYHCALTGYGGSLQFGSGTQVIVTPSVISLSRVFAGPRITVINTAGNRLTFGGGTRVLVKPNIKNPDPAVYQLRSPKSSNTSVCLFTDFDSKITNVTQEPGVFGSSSTALDMKAMGSKSNGALRWSASSFFSCESTFNESFYSSSEIPCDATLIEKSFETDMNLNFQNLSVIGLRILFLKVAGFNLLMTLRLWSS